MLHEFRIEKFKNNYVVAKISDIRLKENDILYRGFTDKENAIDFLRNKYEIEDYNDVSYEEFYKEEYRDVLYTRVTCIEGIELTTEELLQKLENIIGYIPYTIEHYRGRREGEFYQYEHLWMNSIRSGKYQIDDYGNVTVN